eukprot:5629058-Pleurochrysis_carterae.AAC.1
MYRFSPTRPAWHLLPTAVQPCSRAAAVQRCSRARANFGKQTLFHRRWCSGVERTGDKLASCLRATRLHMHPTRRKSNRASLLTADAAIASHSRQPQIAARAAPFPT